MKLRFPFRVNRFLALVIDVYSVNGRSYQIRRMVNQILRYPGQPLVCRPDGRIDALLLQLNVSVANVELQAGNSNQTSV